MVPELGTGGENLITFVTVEFLEMHGSGMLLQMLFREEDVLAYGAWLAQGRVSIFQMHPDIHWVGSHFFQANGTSDVFTVWILDHRLGGGADFTYRLVIADLIPGAEIVYTTEATGVFEHAIMKLVQVFLVFFP